MTTPYDSADPELLEEIISQGEKRLQAQLELGKAADQRAMTFAGLLFAGVAVLIALAFGNNASAIKRPELICVAAGFVISAALAGWSAKPSEWDIVGNVPKSFLNDIAAGLTLVKTRPITAVHIQDMITNNHEILKTNSWLMGASMTVALISAVAGVFSALL